MRHATEVRLSDEERGALERWVNSGTTEQRVVVRARMILAASEGRMTQQIAQRLGVPASRVSKWRRRFARDGIEGLKDAPRSGAPPKYDEETERRVLAALNLSPPEGYESWTGTLWPSSWATSVRIRSGACSGGTVFICSGGAVGA